MIINLTLRPAPPIDEEDREFLTQEVLRGLAELLDRIAEAEVFVVVQLSVIADDPNAGIPIILVERKES